MEHELLRPTHVHSQVGQSSHACEANEYPRMDRTRQHVAGFFTPRLDLRSSHIRNLKQYGDD